MRICSVDRIPQKATLAKSIYDSKGTFLLRKDSPLRDSIVQKLKNNGIFFVYIQDDISEGIEVSNVVDDELKAEIIFSFKDMMEKKMKNNRTSNTISSEEVLQLENIIGDLLSEVRNNSDLSYIAVELMGTDMSTYFHSVNTAIISLLIALESKLGMTMCRNIGLGAILHDVGKVKVDNDILNQLAPFSKEELHEMRQHVSYGYDMIRNTHSLNGIVKSIVLKHHEKLDGSGYPNGIEAEEIPDYVRIVTMADMFDAMTSDRVYRRKMSVHNALEHLMADCIDKIDAGVYNRLTKKVVLFPPGTVVTLNEGSRAIVVKYQNDSPTRPIVRILDSSNFTVGEEIDLMKVLNILIESIET